jgi:hypothetical protein
MSDLKPCPFCGSECELQEIQYAFDLKQYAKHPYNDCILGSFRLVPISLWQSRPIEDALQNEIDKLCAELGTNSKQISIQNDSVINLQKYIDALLQEKFNLTVKVENLHKLIEKEQLKIEHQRENIGTLLQLYTSGKRSKAHKKLREKYRALKAQMEAK